MPIVAGVRLRYSKTLWFDPADSDCHVGDVVIVTTQRGEEIGLVSSDPIEVEESAITSPLKPVVRVATEADLERAIELGEQEKAAMPIFRELIAKHKLDVKPIDVDYLFGGDKVTFYFVSDDRIDFRNLVKDLASHFHQRIDMRQVGVRDEARMVGGLGHCGEVLCCHRLGGEFQPVSIKMAKAQGLSLNPVKISGMCGRLMCCLRYESEAYVDFNGRSPRKGAFIKTPRGDAKVTDIDALREIITMRFQNEDGNTVKVPLAKMSCKGGGADCKCSVSEDVLVEIEEAQAEATASMFSSFAAPLRDSERVVSNGTSEKVPGGRGRDRGERGPSAGAGSGAGRGRRGGAASAAESGDRGGDKGADAGADKAGSGEKRSRRRRGGRGGRGSGEGGAGQASSSAERGGQSQDQGAPSAQRGEGAGDSSGSSRRRSRRGGRNRGAGQGGAGTQGGSQGSSAASGSGDRSPHVAPVDTRVPRRRNRSAE